LSASTGADAAAPAAAAIAAAPAAAHHAPVLLQELLLSVDADAAVAVAAVHMPGRLAVQLHAASQCRLLGKLRCAASTDRNSMLAMHQALASVLMTPH
jgi:hypothetical protein